LRETFFKIDLPDGTPGNAYWAIEVTGIDQDLNFELRSKYLNGASTYVTSPNNGTDGASEGGYADFDHPCSSRVLEPAVSITSTTDDIPGCDGNDSLGDIDPASTSQGADGNTAVGSGTKRVYFNMNGAVTGQKDYYFLRVFIESTDPRYNDWAEVKICDISFQGPYSTAALADAGGTPDLQCLSCDISDVAITTNGTCNGSNAEFTLNFDVAEGSGDYEIFAVADNATLGITTGDILGTITSAGAAGTDVAIMGTVANTTISSTISVDIRDTNDPTGCLSGSPVDILIPACCVVTPAPTTSAIQPTCAVPMGTIIVTAPALAANEVYVVTGTNPVLAAQSNTTGIFESLAAGDYEVIVNNTVTGCSSTVTTLTLNAVTAGTVGGTTDADDFDGDGVNNLCDLDDDNDGVLDTEEYGCTFVRLTPTILGITSSGTAQSGTAQIGTSLGLANDSDFIVNYIDANFNSATNANSLYVDETTPNSVFTITTTSKTFLRLTHGASISTTDGIDYFTVPNTTQFPFTGTLNTGFIDVSTPPNTLGIQKTGSASGNSGGTLAWESPNLFNSISFEVSTSDIPLVQSNYFFEICIPQDTDGDGMADYLDLDSDNDGCSDALEAGATTDTTTDYAFPDIDANNDGLVDAVDAGNDGMTDYASTYSDALNDAITNCITCTADAGDISNNSSTPGTLTVCQGSDLLDGATEIIFSADYTAGDETDAGAGYEYAFVLANAAGTIQTTSTDGNFDFSGITAGTYTVHGVSYSTSNTINTVATYLASITGDATVDDISQIETDEAGVICVDIDNGALTGQTTTVTINSNPNATVTSTAAVCSVATETGEDEGQEDLDALVTAGDMTGTWTILSGNVGGTATITGTMAGGDVVFDAGTEAGPIVVQYTLTGTAPCIDATYDVTISRFECGVCAPAVGITRGN